MNLLIVSDSYVKYVLSDSPWSDWKKTGRHKSRTGGWLDQLGHTFSIDPDDQCPAPPPVAATLENIMYE